MKPIETAPKDGSKVLLSNGKEYADGYWLAEAYGGNGAWIWPYIHKSPTYWSELPEEIEKQLASCQITLRIKEEEHTCCAEDLRTLQKAGHEGWKEAAIAWEVCASVHEKWGKMKDALYSTRQSDFKNHANNARRMYLKGG